MEETAENGPAMTYIVAQNPAILAQLMRESEKRGVNPSAYTEKASVFNVLSVDFDQTTENKQAEEIPFKTNKIPAMELDKLQKDTVEIFEKCHPNPHSMSNYTYPQVSGNEGEGESSYLPMTSPSTAGLPPQPPDAKSKSLERNLSQNAVFSRISSLERRQQQISDYSMKTGQRSHSLIRQYSAGLQQVDNAAMRSASLERNQQMPIQFKAPYSNSFEKTPPPPPYVRPVKGGSLERSQAIIMNDLMRKYYDQKALNDAQKPRSGGSLERNVQYQQYLMIQKQQLQQQLQAQQHQQQFQALQQQAQQQQQQQLQAQQQQQLQAQQQYQALQHQAQQQQQQQQLQALQQQQQQGQPQEEIIEENIYDFGGCHVKSCATIALKKSIERGMLPPTTMIRSPVFDPASNPPSGPSSLESRPPVQQTFASKQPLPVQPGIASRMMIFQQGSLPAKTPQLQIAPNTQNPFPNPNVYNPQLETEAMMEPPQVREKQCCSFFSVLITISVHYSVEFVSISCVYFQ